MTNAQTHHQEAREFMTRAARCGDMDERSRLIDRAIRAQRKALEAEVSDRRGRTSGEARAHDA